jgi:hypothetical protein
MRLEDTEVVGCGDALVETEAQILRFTGGRGILHDCCSPSSVAAVSSPTASQQRRTGSPAPPHSSARSRHPREPTNRGMRVHCATLLELLLFCSTRSCRIWCFCISRCAFLLETVLDGSGEELRSSVVGAVTDILGGSGGLRPQIRRRPGWIWRSRM